jgi:predicted GNAT family acetyltransferase
MKWMFTVDAEEYAAHAVPLLSRDPARNTIALTVIDSVRDGRIDLTGPCLFGWYGDSGTVSWTPPYELLLGPVPEDALDDLVAALRARGAAPRGVNGEVAAARRFAAAWTAGTTLRAQTVMRMRLYALGELVPPEVSGRARPAGVADLPRVAAFVRAFFAETHTHGTSSEATQRADVEAGRVWLWEDGGTPVSVAFFKPPAAGTARIGPVYTPPEHRRRGYAGAVTAAASAAALAAGARQAVLFTDLANPTSNSVYQRIGYRPVTDREALTFR